MSSGGTPSVPPPDRSRLRTRKPDDNERRKRRSSTLSQGSSGDRMLSRRRRNRSRSFSRSYRIDETGRCSPDSLHIRRSSRNPRDLQSYRSDNVPRHRQDRHQSDSSRISISPQRYRLPSGSSGQDSSSDRFKRNTRICQTPEPRSNTQYEESREDSRYKGKNYDTLNASDLSKADETSLLGKLVNMLSNRNHTESLDVFTHGAQNVIPDFNPQTKEQSMKSWLAKINETAQIYGWTDRHKIFYSLPKLKGLAKRWFDSLPSVNHSWPEWQEKLLTAFPNEINYGELLSEMLNRRSRESESLEEYYYDKIMLINQCELKGRQAIDCLINGIHDNNIKMNINGLLLHETEDVLKYFRKISKAPNMMKKFSSANQANNIRSASEIVKKSDELSEKKTVRTCYNCSKAGHLVYQCPEVIKKCVKCTLYGHLEKDCTGTPSGKKRPPSVHSTVKSN